MLDEANISDELDVARAMSAKTKSALLKEMPTDWVLDELIRRISLYETKLDRVHQALESTLE